MDQRSLDKDPVGQTLMVQEGRLGAGCRDRLPQSLAYRLGQRCRERTDVVGRPSLKVGFVQQGLATLVALLQPPDQLLFAYGHCLETFPIGADKQLAFLVEQVE